ncbi:hypothetical protein CIHG_07501 [Coccidioides immitis H538.4]|uniref:Uncharacterized protein n=1 Tax=Coccidioides immitis H538.4 TaxID=396776 RepID=A0A0J8RZZ1_COCIT|nr:hypothetical protein CIHG_07501 [Coccidioides immitis H538.4]
MPDSLRILVRTSKLRSPSTADAHRPWQHQPPTGVEYSISMLNSYLYYLSVIPQDPMFAVDPLLEFKNRQSDGRSAQVIDPKVFPEHKQSTGSWKRMIKPIYGVMSHGERDSFSLPRVPSGFIESYDCIEGPINQTQLAVLFNLIRLSGHGIRVSSRLISSATASKLLSGPSAGDFPEDTMKL